MGEITDGENTITVVVSGVVITSYTRAVVLGSMPIPPPSPVISGKFEALSIEPKLLGKIVGNTFVMTNAIDVNQGMKDVLCDCCKRKIEALERLTDQRFGSKY